MNVLRLDEVGRRLRDIYMTKFQYGFPFLTKLEVEESPEEPSMVLAEEFKQFPIYVLVLMEEAQGRPICPIYYTFEFVMSSRS